MTCQWNVIYAGPTRMAPRLLWGSIRCLRIIPVRSWPRISTKGNGEEMSSLLGRPASVTRFLLPLSGRDPETVLTPGSFSGADTGSVGAPSRGIPDHRHDGTCPRYRIRILRSVFS